MRKSGYVNVNVNVEVSESVSVDEIIDEISDELLIEEIKERGLNPIIDVIKEDPINYKTLCDVFGVNYYTTIDDLLKMLEEKLHYEK